MASSSHYAWHEAIHDGVKVDKRMEDAALRRRLASLAKKRSTALSRELGVGLQWKVKRRCRWSHSQT
jgi:hypothetical protein